MPEVPRLARYLAKRFRIDAAEAENAIEEFYKAAEEGPCVHPSSPFDHAMKHGTGNIVAEFCDLSPSQLARKLKSDRLSQRYPVRTLIERHIFRLLLQSSMPPCDAAILRLYLERYFARSGKRFCALDDRQADPCCYDYANMAGTQLTVTQLLCSQGVDSVFTWRGVPCYKSVYDVAIYLQLIHEVRPEVIIELGTAFGGSALLLADLTAAMQLETEVHTVDRLPCDPLPRSGNLIRSYVADCIAWFDSDHAKRSLSQSPRLIVEDFHGDLAALGRKVSPMLEPGDYLVIEDSIGKQDAIRQLLVDDVYRIDTKYTDFFGINCTTAINSILVKL